ncbi:MAG: GntR family transcriptional regulator [Lachnospiraceae bacterium]|nr:GntR family transcriptional regulator [Lachnospiraceae bacterium]MBQ8547874.1 GntR family transcriptional regulator [Lachnospiraceae bacterium]MBQ8846237.1 GntR family transcriptional regulator [Lachnospiraceae bacterium]
MQFVVSGQSTLPIYEQIIGQVKTAIVAGDVKPGDMLPSIRALAKDLQISVITTKRAYEELEKEGLIYSVSGKGFYVCEQNTDLLREKKLAMAERHMLDCIKECREAGMEREDIMEMVEVLLDSE